MNARTAAIKSLNIIADEIKSEISSCEVSFLGRTASIAAEQFLRDTINRRKQNLIDAVNSSLLADGAMLVELNADDPETEADTRRMDDLNLTVELDKDVSRANSVF